MNTRSVRVFRTRLSCAVFALLLASLVHADTTFSFQNGANGYSGAKDVSINTQYAQYNSGNGTQWTGGSELGCYTVSGSNGYTVRYLLKFGNLTLPAGSTVVSATLTLGFDYWNPGPGNITGYYLKNSWDPASANTGWIHRDVSHDWASPGASSAGVDTVSGKTFAVPALHAVGNQKVTIALDKAVVQSWIDSASANQGIMLVNNLVDDTVNPLATTGTAKWRPVLTIVVASAAGVQVSVTPTSATLQPGQTTQFSATVTGNSNTAVTWSATGGTISNNGLFTAGAANGNFSVTATSAADTTKSASAQVTIQNVAITVNPTSATLQSGQTRQFSATVTGNSNTAVTWSTIGGTISSSGLFTAGSTAGANFRVTATSVADTTKSASAQITIQSAPAVTVTVAPTSATVQPGQTKQFTATIAGSSNTSVTWTATGGTISTSGLFTAGSTAGNSFKVTATSVADPTKSASATMTITPVPVSITISPISASLQAGQTQQFTATVTGSSNTSATWAATGGTISSSGLYTAGQNAGSFAVTATSVADSTKKAAAGIQIATVQTSLPPVPRMSDGAYVVIQSPVSGMHFTAPATIRMYADPYDPNATDDPDAITVNFLMNGQPVGTYTGSGAKNGYFPITVSNIAAGAYSITAQITSGGHTVASFPVTVFVDTPKVSSGPVFNLTSDVVLSGAQSLSYAGTPANHCAINGNGFQIRSAANFTGSLNVSYCDIRNLGTAANPSINVTTGGTGSIQIVGNVFDTFGTVALEANGTAQLIVRNNEFRENTLVPVTSLPIAYSGETLPVVSLSGNSPVQKFFQGNNVGLSTVFFDGTQNWLVGGSTDAESNILIGVRCGFTVENSSNIVLRGNYSQHNYPHRFSQGDNFQLDGDGFLVEHNVIRSSSWPVRGMGGELRYNLIDASGNSDQVIQGPMSNTNMHHNVITFTVSQTFYSPGTGLRVMYNADNVQFHNNTMDGGGTFMNFSGSPVTVLAGAFIGSLRNNVFYNFESSADMPILTGDFGESTNPPLARLRYADYNDFYNPNAPNQVNYGLGVVGKSPGSAGYGMHDLGGLNGHVNPKFAAPTALPFPFSPQDIWTRTKRVSDVLAMYRAMYTPASGSPLIGAGDPQDGSGGNIGAIGNRESTDQFGLFGNGATTPSAPVITSFAASPTSISTGQTSTLSWSVTGATSLSIAPGVGNVTGTSVSVSPGTTTTYTLTATNAGGSATATSTVTVSGGTTISVTISPTSASVAAGATRQFAATVTGASNSSVNWTATGGTISSSGLYAAGSTVGSFAVTATSVQDSTKKASAAITITAPQGVSVSINPTSASLFTSGTQQFAATVTNASNTAVTWSATGGSISSSGFYTAGTAAGGFTVTATSVQDSTKSASASVTIGATEANGAHPRMILDTPTLAALRSRMSAKTPEWTRLKAVCDGYIGGTAQFINGNDYIDPPNIGEGYQGSGYHDSLMPLGLCYQTIRASDPATAAKYATAAISILMAMSDPAHQTADDCNCQVPLRDYGFGIRFFGVAMAIGYDWFHDVLTQAQLSQLRTALDHWINLFENNPNSNFEYTHPQGNYYAGYYAAKCFAALAAQGDDPIGDTWWNAWYNHEHLGRVVPYYQANLAGGGWTEGYAQYGILATRNQSLPALAVKTAKGIDLIQAGTAQAYTYPADNPRWLMAFTWPTRDLIDDRGELYSTGDPAIWPGTGNIDTYRFSAGILSMLGDPAAPMMHKYARDAKTALDAIGAGGSTEWVDFLFWDPNAPETSDYSSLPNSYLAPGMGGVTARSDWSNTATFLSFMAGPYINNPGAGHEAYDKGSLAIERNKNPLLVNADAWLTHEAGRHDADGHSDGDDGWSITFDDRYGNWSSDHSIGNRRLYNTFQVRQLDGSGNLVAPFGQSAAQRSDGARTKIGRFEDRGSYVLAVGQFLQDMYYAFHNPATGQPTICPGASSAVTSLTRQIVYLRPSQFVVYDRSGICDASLDQYLAFHFAANPVEVTAPGPGLHRFDVNTGQFAGSMTTILPANASFTTTSQFGSEPITWNKVWRTEIRPTDAPAANRRWMTVFDLAASSAQVAKATAVNVTGGNAVGALLQSSAGNSVVLSSSALDGTGITGGVSYIVPAAQTRHVITDLGISAGYTISVVVSGTNHMVTITPGGSSVTSANGVLTFQAAVAGQVTP